MTIKEIREYTGMTQIEFSEYYGIPKSTIEKWEAGFRNPPAYLVTLLERAAKEDFKKD